MGHHKSLVTSKQTAGWCQYVRAHAGEKFCKKRWDCYRSCVRFLIRDHNCLSPSFDRMEKIWAENWMWRLHSIYWRRYYGGRYWKPQQRDAKWSDWGLPKSVARGKPWIFCVDEKSVTRNVLWNRYQATKLLLKKAIVIKTTIVSGWREASTEARSKSDDGPHVSSRYKI